MKDFMKWFGWMAGACAGMVVLMRLCWLLWDAIDAGIEWCSARIREKKEREAATTIDFADMHDYYTGGVKSGWES